MDSKVAKLYTPFFLFYGIVHIGGGIAIAFFPSVLKWVLNTPPHASASVLLAFLSCLAGLGFFGGAFVESLEAKRKFVLLAIAGNVINFSAHFFNFLRGDSPVSLVILAAVGIFAMIAVLMTIRVGLARSI